MQQVETNEHIGGPLYQRIFLSFSGLPDQRDSWVIGQGDRFSLTGYTKDKIPHTAVLEVVGLEDLPPDYEERPEVYDPMATIKLVEGEFVNSDLLIEPWQAGDIREWYAASVATLLERACRESIQSDPGSK